MKRKLNLEDLKVKSFITEEIQTGASTIKGGDGNTNFPCAVGNTEFYSCEGICLATEGCPVDFIETTTCSNVNPCELAPTQVGPGCDFVHSVITC